MSWNMEEALSYYRGQGAPADQNALVGLLKEIQQEQGGGIPVWAEGKLHQCRHQADPQPASGRYPLP